MARAKKNEETDTVADETVVDIKKVGVAEIDAVIKALSKSWSEDLSPQDYGNLTFFPSGSVKLDCLLSRGGIPDSRMIEITGDTGTFKTSLALKLMAAKQQRRKEQGIKNKRDLILDLEYSLEKSFIEQLGVDLEQVIWQRFKTAEEALQYAIELVKTGRIDTVVLDSVDALQTAAQLAKEAGEDVVGGASKVLSKAIRELSKLVDEGDSTCTFIFINQIRLNPGQMFGNPQTNAGGKSIGYYSRLRLKLLPRKEHPEVPGAYLMRIEVLKTSIGPPVNEEIHLCFIPGKGFDEVYDIESFAKSLGILKHTSGQSKIQWTADSEPVPLLKNIPKGKEAAFQALREHPLLLARLREACLRAYGISTALPDSYFTESMAELEKMLETSTTEGETPNE